MALIRLSPFVLQKTMLQVGIREYGIYTFPDGTRVIARSREPVGTLLYYLSDWQLFGGREVEAERNAPAFRIVEADHAGQIFRFGMRTRWHLDDLSDTGQTAR